MYSLELELKITSNFRNLTLEENKDFKLIFIFESLEKLLK